jgi:hypothetical protein
MTTQETKIELVTEALETVIRACVAHQTSPPSHKNFVTVVEARQALADSLKILLAPNLRVLEGFHHGGPPALKSSRPNLA